MVYAPVVITTLCRYEHFKNCLESLGRNKYADKTTVYIGVDYPKAESHREGYNRICEYLETVTLGFADVIIFKRDHNFGALKNINDLLEQVEKEHDRCIITEDDNVFSPYFLAYMDTMLERIKDNDDIYGVCGYSYPVEWKGHGNKELKLIRLQTAFPGWGMGTLFSKLRMFRDIYNTDYLARTAIMKEKSNRIRRLSALLFFWYVSRTYQREVYYYDIDTQLYQIFADKYSILPSASLVRNMGWDGTGQNCSRPFFDFSQQDMYLKEEGFEELEIPEHNEENEKLVWQFLDQSMQLGYYAKIRTLMKFYLFRLRYMLRQC